MSLLVTAAMSAATSIVPSPYQLTISLVTLGMATAGIIFLLIDWKISRRLKSDEGVSSPSILPKIQNLAVNRAAKIKPPPSALDVNLPGDIKRYIAGVGLLQRSAAINKFLGQKVQWAGIVDHIKEEPDGRYRITVKYDKTKYGSFFALLELSDDLERLKMRDQVTIQGTIFDVAPFLILDPSKLYL